MNKEKLIRDLCARLPYGVKVLYDNKVFSIDYVSSIHEEIKLDTRDNYTINVSDVKPYLFPLSSMTEEQKMFLKQQNWCIAISTSGTIETTVEGIDWHEFGHTFQNCLFGPLFPLIVAIPSAIRY